MKRISFSFIVILIGIIALGAYVWFSKGSHQPIVAERTDVSGIEETELPGEISLMASDGISGSASVASDSDSASEEDSKSSGTSSAAAVSAASETQKAPTSGIAVIDRFVSFGFSVPSKSRTIDTIVIHSSYDPNGDDPYSVAAVIAIWKSYGVAPHYMIDRKGNIYRLVKDADIAYHAGVSKMADGRTNVNDFSIGIEMLDTKDDEYTDAQYAAVKSLIGFLKGKYPITSVVGHDDIAPGRKTDPWNFEWKRLK